MVYFDEGELTDLALGNHQVEELLDLNAVDLAVDDFELAQLVRNVLEEERLESLDREGINLVALVDDALEVFDIDEAVEDRRELVASQPAVIEERSAHQAVIDKLTGFSDALTLALVQGVVLEAQSLPVDLFENRKEQLVLLHTHLQVLVNRVRRLHMGNVAHLEFFVCLHALDELVCLRLDRAVVFTGRALEQTLQFVFGLAGQGHLLFSSTLCFLQLLKDALLEGHFDQVLLSHVSDLIREVKHGRHVVVRDLQVDQIRNFREILHVLVHLVNGLLTLSLMALVSAVNRQDTLHVLAIVLTLPSHVQE